MSADEEAGEHGAVAAVVCSVGYVPGEGGQPSAGVLADVVPAVEQRAEAWVARIAAFLSVAPDPVVVTVYGGSGVARTRGSHVVLPVNGDGHGVLAGLAHELVHAVAGRSPDPVLNEGLAVHVDGRLRLAGPAWPFYHLSPHRWMEVFREEGWRISLADLTAMAGARPVSEHRDSVRSRAVQYLHAASFTGHLFERLGEAEFWQAFRSGRAMPTGADAASVEEGWLATLGAPLTEEERRLRDRSLAIVAHAR